MLSGLLMPGCTTSVDVSFRLVPPCNDQGLLAAANCQFIRVIISALGPSDPLHPDQIEAGFGPIAKTCEMGESSCKINGDELIGPGRMVDVLCYPTLQVEPVARATSGSLLFDDSGDGIGGLKASLLLGPILGFAETTHTNPKAPEFGQCSKMAESAGRYGHASVTLADGRVLTTGGIRRFAQGVEEILPTAEIFDPVTGEHRFVLDSNGQAARMHASSGRAFHTMTLLRSGEVLIAGGMGPIEGVRKALASAEVFDPKTETFEKPMNMGSGRAHHAATTLATGMVLLTGGATYNNSGVIGVYLNSAVIYDPSSGSWTDVSNNMSSPRAFHQAIMLDPATTQGRVIVIGGENEGGASPTVDIFNPNGLQFYAGVDVVMARSRSRFCAVRLSSGRVMVAGGSTVRDDPGTPDLEYSPDNGVEIYDSGGGGDFGAFTADVLNLSVARMHHSCSLLEDGNVVIAGGLTGGGMATGLGELLRDAGNVYTVEQLPVQLNPPRFMHTAVTLRNAWVLLLGGLPNQGDAESALREGTLFVPPPAFQ
jgi:hypothetical protein